MKTKLTLLLALGMATFVGAQTPTAPPPAPELEKQFIATLTDATLAGRWCLVRDGQLTPERDEQYRIASVQKLDGDRWTINAQLQYGQRSIVVPVPVRVQWAGGAAIIIVDDMTVPGGGTYSARVLIHGGAYTGTWSGGARTGVLHGVISRSKPESSTPKVPNP
jgi:hypothetical protein